MDVIWTPEAIDRLEDIHYYLKIKQKAPIAAQEMVRRLVSRVPQISDMPLSGRQVADYDNPSVREVIESSYRIIYQVADNAIYILSIMHCRQRLPNYKAMKAAANDVIEGINR
ncbi:MAG: type II toxin-antitoxin system RelE/ParE family toxin [Spongiibacteraceae bacterium]|nr:type II toxin-antitoxin system RelE/ParE family toxin [Spongiibacteraceae bacterium]